MKASLPLTYVHEVLEISCEGGELKLAELVRCHKSSVWNSVLATSNEVGWNPIFVACVNNSKDVAEYLLLNSPDHGKAALSALDQQGWSALKWRNELGYPETFPGAPNSQGNNELIDILFDSILSDNIKIVQVVLKSPNCGVVVNKKKDIQLDGNSWNSAFTPLMLAAYHGKLDVIQCFMTHALYTVKQELENGGTLNPLNLACGQGHLNVVKVLSTIDSANTKHLLLSKGNTISPLSVAVVGSHTKVVSYLLEQYKEEVDGMILGTENKKLTLPFTWCCISGNKDIAELMLSAASPLTVQKAICNQNLEGKTPLMSACENGKVEIVRLLTTKYQSQVKESLTLKTKKGEDVLTFCTSQGNVEQMDLVLNCDKGSSEQLLNDTLNSDTNILMLACESGKFRIVKYLLEKQHDFATQALEAKNIHGRTALAMACRNGHFEIMQFIVDMNKDEAQALLSEEDEDGNSPLMHACSSDWIKVVDVLQEIILTTFTPGSIPYYKALYTIFKCIVSDTTEVLVGDPVTLWDKFRIVAQLVQATNFDDMVVIWEQVSVWPENLEEFALQELLHSVYTKRAGILNESHFTVVKAFLEHIERDDMLSDQIQDDENETIISDNLEE